jgi:hypothetical protein
MATENGEKELHACTGAILFSPLQRRSPSTEQIVPEQHVQTKLLLQDAPKQNTVEHVGRKTPLMSKRYVYHNPTKDTYDIFLLPEAASIAHQARCVYIRTTGLHVKELTKLFVLKADECIVLCGGVSVAEMCRKNGKHVCVGVESGDWFRDEKKKNPANGEYQTLCNYTTF